MDLESIIGKCGVVWDSRARQGCEHVFLADISLEWSFKGRMDLARPWWGEEYSRKRMQRSGSLSDPGAFGEPVTQ